MKPSRGPLNCSRDVSQPTSASQTRPWCQRGKAAPSWEDLFPQVSRAVAPPYVQMAGQKMKRVVCAQATAATSGGGSQTIRRPEGSCGRRPWHPGISPPAGRHAGSAVFAAGGQAFSAGGCGRSPGGSRVRVLHGVSRTKDLPCGDVSTSEPVAPHRKQRPSSWCRTRVIMTRQPTDTSGWHRPPRRTSCGEQRAAGRALCLVPKTPADRVSGGYRGRRSPAAPGAQQGVRSACQPDPKSGEASRTV